MPIKSNKMKEDHGSDPLPYCNIPRPMRNYNMSFDNCFSPQAKTQTQIYSPNKSTKSNVSYPYYMPEDWFTVAPPMGIEVEEEEEEIRKFSKLSISMEPPETLIREMEKMKMAETTKKRGVKVGHSTSRGGGHRLERFKIKTLNLGGAVVKKRVEEHR